jgi:hypothetical protein
METRISSVLLEIDIDSRETLISSVLMEIDTDSRQAEISSVLIEIDLLDLSYLLIGRHEDTEYVTGFIFRDVDVARDSVIQEARLRLYSMEAAYSIKCSVKASPNPNLFPSGFTTGSMPANVYPLTSGSALLTSGSSSSGSWIQSDDLYCVIQEIVSQDTWTSGCSIGLIVAGDYIGEEGNEYGFHKVRKGVHTDGAKLDITWLEP